jgi:hypothetical protein
VVDELEDDELDAAAVVDGAAAVVEGAAAVVVAGAAAAAAAERRQQVIRGAFSESKGTRAVRTQWLKQRLRSSNGADGRHTISAGSERRRDEGVAGGRGQSRDCGAGGGAHRAFAWAAAARGPLAHTLKCGGSDAAKMLGVSWGREGRRASLPLQ